jgi:hypothetical protein
MILKDGGNDKWLSAAFAEKALFSALRFPILIALPTECGSPTSEKSR